MQHCACNPNQSSIGKCYSQILLQFCALSSDLVFLIGHLIIDLRQPQLLPLTTWPGATVWKKNKSPLLRERHWKLQDEKLFLFNWKFQRSMKKLGAFSFEYLIGLKCRWRIQVQIIEPTKWFFFNWSWQDFSKYQPVSKFRHLELFFDEIYCIIRY